MGEESCLKQGEIQFGNNSKEIQLQKFLFPQNKQIGGNSGAVAEVRPILLHFKELYEQDIARIIRERVLFFYTRTNHALFSR